MADNREAKKFEIDLTEEESILVTLRDELYAGSWEKMEQDLKDRLQGRPYIFKLVNRIQEDLDRIAKLSGIERDEGINLADYNEC
jgi:hypothetical protein